MGEISGKKELLAKLQELTEFVERCGDSSLPRELEQIIEYNKILYTDGLSNLGNRTAFNAHKKELETNPNVACVMIDVNNLKVCNDKYGHREGDKLICDCAECISKAFAGIGGCYRIGGDEFAVLIGDADEAKIVRALDKLNVFIEDKNNDRILDLSIAYGYAIRKEGESMEQVINRSDSFMYEMKYQMKMESPVFTRAKVFNFLNVLEILSHNTDDYLFLYDLDEDKNWIFGNVEAKYELTTNQNGEITLDDILKITHKDDRSAISRNILLVANGKKKSYDVNHRWHTKDGEVVWLNCRATAICDEKNIPHVMIGRVSEEAVRHLFNPLTGLFNKIQMMADLKQRFEKEPSGYLLIVDVDDLAAINLSHGREYGDELIKKIAISMQSQPEFERVYHIEHNYFAVWVNADSKIEVHSAFARVQNAVIDCCTLSAGAAPMDKNIFADEVKLYDSAKLILRDAKKMGKGAVEFYTKEEIREKLHAVALLEELHESVKNNYSGFYINYQPQLKAGSYKICGVEALARYRSRDGIMVFPNEFIPLLEQSRLIEKVGLWVLENALIQCSKWRKTEPNLKISVNFSTIQFKDREIAAKVIEILQKTNMPGSALTIEITESIQLEGAKRFTTSINELKKHGVSIAIDDFGTGYSNIGYLKKLDIDEVKIDRMFVRDLQEDTYNYRLISNTIELAKTNNIKVCCEGVETKEELVILEQLSPDSMQGYLFEKPTDADTITSTYFDAETSLFREREEFIEELYIYKTKKGAVRFDTKAILRETNVGLWKIHYNPKNEVYHLYADDTMERIMGVNKKYAPEDCYRYWFNRIKDEQKEYVSKNIKLMTTEEKVVQLQYEWDHPEFGMVTVKSSGRYVEDVDGMVVIEGYHRILSDIKEV